MSQQTRPRLASHALDLPNHCDICNRARSIRVVAADVQLPGFEDVALSEVAA